MHVEIPLPPFGASWKSILVRLHFAPVTLHLVFVFKSTEIALDADAGMCGRNIPPVNP